MIIDMHVHTRLSGDSSATVEKYCRAIQKYRRHRTFDGIVLTEHSMYDRSNRYRRIGEKYHVRIFQGIEVDTNLGHLLIYGVTDRFLKKIDILRKSLHSEKVIKTINDCNGIAIPAHPFRASKYGKALLRHDPGVDEISVIEELNGCNSPEENRRAKALAEQNGMGGIGGSDAHYANRIWFLNSATEFDSPIHTMEDLVKELRQGHFRAVTIDNTIVGEF
jgi:predicted metal-dependent phosphoesterase TrpH